MKQKYENVCQLCRDWDCTNCEFFEEEIEYKQTKFKNSKSIRYPVAQEQLLKDEVSL